MKYDYHIIVIGAGSAGLVVASGASNLGAKVALIEGNKMGGDCLNYGCIPSKTFLHTGHTLFKAQKLKTIEHLNYNVNLKSIANHVSEVIEAIAPHDSKERYESLGVDVFNDYGTMIDEHTVSVDNKLLTAKFVVIATGSSPNIPEIDGLEDCPYYTNETIFSLEEKPRHMIALGAGPIALELGQAYAHIGSKVTIINRSLEIFKKDEPEVQTLMYEKLSDDGINFKMGYHIVKVEKNNTGIMVTINKNGKTEVIQGDCLLLALGREPNTSNLGLNKINIETSKRGYIVTNNKLRSTCPSVYACGDVVGPYLFTHTASYQASVVIQNIIFPFKRKINYRHIPWVTYTLPEVAHIGLLEKDTDGKVYLVELNKNDRAKTNDEKVGFLKLITDKKGTLVGATMVSENAGEQIALANIAISKKMKLKSFLSMIVPYPTEIELYQHLALTELKESFKPWQKNIVKKIFLRD